MKKNKSSNILPLVVLAIVVVLTIIAVGTSRSKKDDSHGNVISNATPTPTEEPLVSQEPQNTDSHGTEETAEPHITEPPVPGDAKIIAFTFDDGPGLYITPELLEVLNKYGAHATFFELGSSLESTSKQNIMKNLIAAGNEIGSHTYSHKYLTQMTVSEIKDEVTKMTSIVKRVADYDVRLLRPPYGKYNDDVLNNAGLAIVTWNVDSRDWEYLDDSVIAEAAKKNGVTEEQERDKRIQELLFEGFTTYASGSGVQIKPLAGEIKDGCIVLFHDIFKATPYLVDALLKYLSENGNYKVVTVSEMIELKGGTVKAGQVYTSAWAS